jgi:hypothetical protein
MVQFAVTMKDGEWTVFRDGKVISSGLSRSAAVEMAEEMAYEAEARNEPVELLIQGYIGDLQRTLSGGE